MKINLYRYMWITNYANIIERFEWSNEWIEKEENDNDNDDDDNAKKKL